MGEMHGVCAKVPTQPTPGKQRVPQGPLNTATEISRDLMVRVSTPYTHLRLITASPGRGCWLVGDWVEKGLLARGLREAGLEQEDRREDWLSECVLTEPCGHRARKSGLPIPLGLAPQASPILQGAGAPS